MISQARPEVRRNRGDARARRRTLRVVSEEPAADAAADATPDVGLVEPARLQVLRLAADVLGKLPADEVPAGLRRFARFAPAKRLRMGAPSIAAALDRDADFRARVAQTLVDTSPELVDAVREGGATTAVDPLDVVAVAYLTRPDGWAELVARATDRWRAEQGGERTSTEELGRLRTEVGELRARVRTERSRIRQAVNEASEESAGAVAELRQALRERTRELRDAQRERDAAMAQVAAGRDELTRERAGHETEVRRLRNRLAEAERGAEAARRETRADRDFDTARLWLLVDTLVQAASGVRRELSLPTPAMKPADAVDSAAGGAAAGRRHVADVPAFEQVLGLPNIHLIVDGYNVTKSGYGDLSLAQQRDRLLGGLAALHAQSGAEITVAFDGGTKPPAQPPVPRGLRVLFSEGEIADDLIRRLVAAEPSGRPVLVVSSDGEVVRDTGRDGAWTVPASVLLTRLG